MTFWNGFLLGMMTMSVVILLFGTPPEKAAQNLHDWARVLRLR